MGFHDNQEIRHRRVALATGQQAVRQQFIACWATENTALHGKLSAAFSQSSELFGQRQRAGTEHIKAGRVLENVPRAQFHRRIEKLREELPPGADMSGLDSLIRLFDEHKALREQAPGR